VPQSIAKYEFRDCLPNTIDDEFETTTGRIWISGYGVPPPARYRYTTLTSTKPNGPTYRLTSGPHTIRPGTYTHTVNGDVVVWEPCHSKLWSVISEVEYDAHFGRYGDVAKGAKVKVADAIKAAPHRRRR
jgi:hypothetical protein